MVNLAFAQMYTLYILYSHKLDKFYIGSTGDLPGRIERHQSVNHGFTAAGRPWILVYTENFLSKTDAMKRESQIKAWKNKSRIKALISKNPISDSLSDNS